ncbi:MAG TPA: substrate-binding domain-containing protein, partial [Nitrospira sp.]|nr:substrate-binding domain-containing protein [Nitrospira sp.]
CATLLWEPMHAGAVTAARPNAVHVYWNAPAQDNDVEKQIGFLQLALDRNYGGIIVAPDETLAFRTPVEHLLDEHVPVVVVDDDLGLPPNSRLAYVLNDEAAGGEVAARRVAERLGGHGSVAMLGINLRLHSMKTRAASFERALAIEAPGIKIVFKDFGGTNLSAERVTAEKMLHSTPRANAIVALSAVSTRAAYYEKIKLGIGSDLPIVGFDQDLLPPIRVGEIDSVVMQKTYQIGLTAMQVMTQLIRGEKVPEKRLIAPVLLTRDTLDSPLFREQRSYVTFRWDQQ